MLPGVTGIAGFGASVPEMVNTDNATNASAGSTQTFNTRSIGAVGPSRLIIVTVGWTQDAGTARTVTGGTIGGISTGAAKCQINDAAGTAPGVAILAAYVPSGTTATIVVNFSGSVSRCIIGVWSAFYVNSDTPTDADANISGLIGGTSGSTSVTSTVDPGGFIVASGLASSNNTTTITFSAGVTEAYEAVSATIRANGGSAAAQTPGNKTVTVSGTNSIAGGWGVFLAAASFR